MLKTDSPNLLLEGYGLTFTLGRGNEIICDMCRSLQHLVVGKDLEADILPDMMGWSRTLTQDGQLRWIGPECVPSPRAAPSGHPPLQRSACAPVSSPFSTSSLVPTLAIRNGAGRVCLAWPVAL